MSGILDLRVIVGISGASGAILGLRLLEKLRRRPEVEIHLILTRSGEKTLHLETGQLAADLKALAHHWHPIENIGSPLASGSYLTDAMVIVPCSIHTMSAIATGLTDNLLTRAADVVLKERRKLILVVRETPLHLGHLRVLTALAELGAVVLPPVPAFYNRPKDVDDIVNHTIARVLDRLSLPQTLVGEWQGTSPRGSRPAGA